MKCIFALQWKFMKRTLIKQKPLGTQHISKAVISSYQYRYESTD